MGVLALAVRCAALGAYVGSDLSGGAGLLLFIGAFAGSSQDDLPVGAGLRTSIPLSSGPVNVPPVNGITRIDDRVDHVRGRATTPHLILEYGDYQCPYSRAG